MFGKFKKTRHLFIECLFYVLERVFNDGQKCLKVYLWGGGNMEKLVILTVVASIVGLYGASQIDYKDSADPGGGHVK